MITVAVLAALGQTEELRAHLAGATNVGLSRDELVEVLMHVSVYAGVPATNAALRVAAEVLGSRRTRDAHPGRVPAELDVGLLLGQGHQLAPVGVAEAGGDGLLHDAQHGGGHRGGHAERRRRCRR